MATAHAPNDILAGYADGSLACGMSLLVASHLTFCPSCRGKVNCIERIAGALLAEEPPVPPAASCLSKVLSRLDGERDAAEPPLPPGASPLPCPLRKRLGMDLDQITWRDLLPGLADHQLDGFDGEDVRLIRARPGVRVPAHTHSGQEATLILTGRMRDGDRTYMRGDIALADDQVDHGPEAVGDETCICLMVLSGTLIFSD